MNEAEKLLEKFARKNMVQWNQESFKRTHSRLHKSIIEALNEALRIHDVVSSVTDKETLAFKEGYELGCKETANDICGRI